MISAPANPAPASPAPSRSAQEPYAAARRAMVDSQLRPSGVNARFVLERMLQVPREEFVPQEARGVAYMDRAVPLEPGADGTQRFLAAPVFHGLMLAEAAPRLADTVLVVDGGSGYLPELLRTMTGPISVITPEQAVRGDVGSAGSQGPFSLLLIDGAVEQIPAPLARLLAEDGRAFTGVIENGVTRLAAGRRVNDTIALLPLAELGIPRLPQFARPRVWTF